MTIMSFLCRLVPGRCEAPPKAEQPTTRADLGQTDAKNKSLYEEQARHMESGEPERSASKGPNLGQEEAKDEARGEGQLGQMQTGRPQKTARRTKPKTGQV
jgi:hypothetical protein